MCKRIFILIFLSTIFSFEMFAQCLSCTSSDSVNYGLVWCHPFNGNAVDATGNGYSGTSTNIYYDADRFGNANSAAIFNGTFSYIAIYKQIPDLTTFTFSFWMKPNTNLSSQGYIFWEGNSVCGNDITIRFYNNKIYFSANKSGATLDGSVVKGEVTFPSTPVGNWWHVVWVMYGSYSEVYLNDSLRATLSYSGSGVSDHYWPTYGAYNDGNSSPCGSPLGVYYVGLLDDSRLYNRAITRSEVHQLYDLQSNSFSVNAGIDQTICKGDSAQLNATSVSFGTYLWSPNFYISDTTIANPKVKPTATTKYLISLTNNGCTAKDSVIINVTALQANAGPDVYSCKKDFIQLNGTGNGNSFTWSPIKYINNNIIYNPIINPDTNMVYVLAVSNGICTSYDTMNVFVTSIDAMINNNDTSICLGDSVQLSTFINGNSFTWNPIFFLNDSNSTSPYIFPDTTTKYFLTVTRGTCVKKDSVTINVVKNLVANAGNDQQICSGNSIQLSGSGPIGAAFLWLPNYALSDNSIQNPIANPLVDTSYFLKVRLGKNCVGYDTVNIVVNPNPTVDAGLDQNICREPFVTIGISSTLADSFFWSPPDGLSNINILQTQASPTTNTTYFIKAMNKVTGCFNFDTVNISLIKPTASFNSDLQSGQLPLNTHYTNTSTNAKNYLWDFGDTTATSSQINTEHIFTKEGLYKVILVAENNGCTDTTFTMIQVTGGLFVFVPNAFTPNADGLNDEFVISYTNGALKKMRGTIWNRWGAKIYEWEMPGGKWWDGKVNGNLVQTDTYVYIIEATNWNDVTKTFSGNFTLLR